MSSLSESTREDLLDVLEVLFGCRHPDFQRQTDTLERIVAEVRSDDRVNGLANELLRFHAPHIGIAQYAYHEWDDLSLEVKREVMGSLRSYVWAINELSDALEYLRRHN